MVSVLPSYNHDSYTVCFQKLIVILIANHLIFLSSLVLCTTLSKCQTQTTSTSCTVYLSVFLHKRNFQTNKDNIFHGSNQSSHWACVTTDQLPSRTVMGKIALEKASQLSSDCFVSLLFFKRTILNLYYIKEVIFVLSEGNLSVITVECLELSTIGLLLIYIGRLLFNHN